MKDNELIMYCIFSKEAVKKMGGNRGKLASMAGHAYLHAWWDADANPFPHLLRPSQLYRDSDAAVKVTLAVETDQDLQELWAKIEEISAGRNYRTGKTLVTDAGRTVFDEPTTCCIGFGPISRDKVPDFIKELPTFL